MNIQNKDNLPTWNLYIDLECLQDKPDRTKKQVLQWKLNQERRQAILQNMEGKIIMYLLPEYKDTEKPNLRSIRTR